MVSKEKRPIPTAVSRARAFIVASLSRTNKFTFTTAAVKTPTAVPARTARANSSIVKVYIVFSKLSPFSLGLVSPECETAPVLELVPAVEVQALAWP